MVPILSSPMPKPLRFEKKFFISSIQPNTMVYTRARALGHIDMEHAVSHRHIPLSCWLRISHWLIISH